MTGIETARDTAAVRESIENRLVLMTPNELLEVQRALEKTDG